MEMGIVLGKKDEKKFVAPPPPLYRDASPIVKKCSRWPFSPSDGFS